MLHIWKIHVTYLDDWSYICERFVFHIHTMMMPVFRVMDMIRHAVACCGTLYYNILIPQHNEIQHTYIYLYSLSNTNIFPVWTIHVTYLNDVTYIDDLYIYAMGDAHLDDCYICGW